MLSCEGGALTFALEALVQGHKKGTTAGKKHHRGRCSVGIVGSFHTNYSISMSYGHCRVLSIYEIVFL